jgi:hypothetical protein
LLGRGIAAYFLTHRFRVIGYDSNSRAREDAVPVSGSPLRQYCTVKGR